MKWNTLDPGYPDIDIHDNHVAGLEIWLEKIVEYSLIYKGDWNVLVADLWPNSDQPRLIGLVQMDDMAIGYDIGFRVIANLENGGLQLDSQDDRPIIGKWLTEAVAREDAQKALRHLHSINPFKIHLTVWGEGKINDAPEIKF